MAGESKKGKEIRNLWTVLVPGEKCPKIGIHKIYGRDSVRVPGSRLVFSNPSSLGRVNKGEIGGFQAAADSPLLHVPFLTHTRVVCEHTGLVWRG